MSLVSWQRIQSLQLVLLSCGHLTRLGVKEMVIYKLNGVRIKILNEKIVSKTVIKGNKK